MDPYTPCPCGSGKKLKFCCQKIVQEMEKLERMQENQPELALQQTEKLEVKYPGNPWVIMTKAGTLMHLDRFKEAKVELLKFLKDHPEHPRANALYGFASLHVDGFPACKKAVHRAFKRCVAESPRIVSALMEALGEHHLLNGHVLAARAHFMLAMRIAPNEEERKALVGTIMRIDSDTAIPFPLRGGNQLPVYEPPEATRELLDKARRLSLLACWEEAAELLEKAAESDPNSAPLWHTIGLFRGWDGNEEAASRALHKAAALYDDDATAIECETIAQFLDSSREENTRAVRLRRLKLTNVSQLLSRLDEVPRFLRSDEDAGTHPIAGDPVATYLLLDREVPSQEELADLTSETVPLYHGRVLVFDASPEDDLPAQAFLSGLEGENLDALVAAFTAAAGDLASPMPATPEKKEPVATPEADFGAGLETNEEGGDEQEILGRIPVEELPLHRNYFIPPGSPGHIRRQVQDAHWDELLNSIWPNTPQAALGGKTPLEASGDPALRRRLEAAVQVLDVFFDERAQLLPIDDVRRTLKLDPPVSPEVDEQTVIPMFSAFDLLRLDVKRLNNRQLSQLVERLMFNRQARLLHKALTEYVDRAWADDEPKYLDIDTAVATLMAISADSRRYDEALSWVDRGRQTSLQASDQAFERNLTWKLRELRVRTTFGHPDELRTLLVDLWENYGAKLPTLRTQLSQVVGSLGIDPPWETAIVTADSLGGGTSWSPSETVPAGDGGKKLWLPGQD